MKHLLGDKLELLVGTFKIFKAYWGGSEALQMATM